MRNNYIKTHIMNRTGIILLVSTKSKQGSIIQKFQKLKDEESGKWNHSGILFETNNGLYVVEETQIEGRKLKASAVIRPIEHYFTEKYELLYLVPNEPIDDIKRFENILLSHVGVPYDYFSLLHDQIIRTMHNIWVGRKNNAWKKMVCHEFVQFVWNKYKNIFKEYYKGDVSKIYHSSYFNKQTTLPSL